MLPTRTLIALQEAHMHCLVSRAAYVRAALVQHWLDLACAALWGACFGAIPWVVLEVWRGPHLSGLPIVGTACAASGALAAVSTRCARLVRHAGDEFRVYRAYRRAGVADPG